MTYVIYTSFHADFLMNGSRYEARRREKTCYRNGVFYRQNTAAQGGGPIWRKNCFEKSIPLISVSAHGDLEPRTEAKLSVPLRIRVKPVVRNPHQSSYFVGIRVERLVR